MAKKSAKQAAELAAYGAQALQAGNLETGLKALRVAAADLPRDGAVRYHLAMALREDGQLGDAMVALSEALARKASLVEAARELSTLMQRYRLETPEDLDPVGLSAALACETVNHQPIVKAALQVVRLSEGFVQAAAIARRKSWDAAAAAVLAERRSPLLQNALLRDALSRGINTFADLEHLLVALRRQILLSVKTDDLLGNKDLFAFALALVAQAQINQFIWPVTSEEEEALTRVSVKADELAAGDIAASAALVRLLLYRDVGETVLADWPAEQVRRIRPKALAALIEPVIADRAQEEALSAGIQSLGEITDQTSQAVSQQYEAAPYPRWTSLNVGAAPVRLQEIRRLAAAGDGAFVDGSLDVLIAGCGTGHHAAQAAVAYGSDARITGLDMSRASLAYATRMAEKFALGNVAFVQADLLDVARLGRTFDVIECVGVLHHMAEPFTGWLRLLDVLKPGGLMYVGLYSAVSRRNIAALRQAPDTPKPGCSDGEARAFRAALMTHEEEGAEGGLTASDDFYTLSDFRDLVLHPCEHQMTLDEISAFLDAEGLAFRGFTLDAGTLTRFAKMFPDAPVPGRLADWAQFEEANPRTFDGMYCFWCQKF